MIISTPEKFTHLFNIICFYLLLMNLDLAAQSTLMPLRTSEPVDSVIIDLQSYIPERMSEADVPGLAIALIRQNKIVWSKGFGFKNRMTCQPVESGTLFEVASISKVITSYITLRLIEQGTLSLDAPVRQYMNEPWLPSSEYSGSITTRHLLSHCSGLGDNILFMNKELHFKPGSEFLYSGVGFCYLQAVIEQVTQKSLEEIAVQLVFQPLDMANSSFICQNRMISQTANGHMRYLLPLLSFLIPFGLIFLIIIIVTSIFYRITAKTWKLPKILLISIFVVPLILTIILLYSIIGRVFPNLVWMGFICSLIFIIALGILYFVINFFLRYFNLFKQRTNFRITMISALIIIVSLFLIKVAGVINGPVFINQSHAISSNGTLRSIAPDLANFLIELAQPRYLSETLAAQIDSPQISINTDFSWGLGMGIQHTSNGNALWQNAISFTFRSVMVIYPETGHGVVVLTNSETGLPVAYDVAERALGGKAQWKLF